MPPLKTVKTAVSTHAARSKEGIVAALRDARAARLAVPRPEEHARRLLFGVTVPVTLLRIAWSDLPTRQSMVRRLLPPLLCVALAAVIGVATTASEPEAHNRLSAAAQASDENDGDDGDNMKIELPPAAAAALAKVTPPPPPPPSGRLSALRSALDVVTSRIVKILAGLGVLEWILVWIGREHHDLMAYETAVLTRVPGDPLGHPPRLRLDFGWLWTKAWRSVRFLLFIALASPIAWLLGEIPKIGAPLSIVVEAVWTAYWASVFAIANTSAAWAPRPLPEPPWFIRWLERAGRVPLLGIPARLYARLLASATRNVWPACMAFEDAPWESAGLALARVVGSIPFVYLVFRPMFTPAATHALLGRTQADVVHAALEP